MSEQVGMTEENKKTIIAFIIGLVIGGLLVYIFAQPGVDDNASPERVTNNTNTEADDEDEENDDDEDVTPGANNGSTSTPVVRDVQTGEGSVSVVDQSAGNRVAIANATFPTNEGWIGVRDYVNGQMTGVLGVARWNLSEGLVPTSVPLLRSTVSGYTYAVVFYSDNGDREFNLATDVQMQGVMDTFEAE